MKHSSVYHFCLVPARGCSPARATDRLSSGTARINLFSAQVPARHHLPDALENPMAVRSAPMEAKKDGRHRLCGRISYFSH